MKKWNAILFDLDDTLFPESQFVAGGFRAVSHWIADRFSLAADAVLDELSALHASGPRDRVFDTWLAQHGFVGQQHLIEMVETYRGHDPKLDLHPGMLPLLNDLHKTRQLGIVSDGYLVVQQRKFAALPLAPLFHAVVFSDQWGHDFWKPHTRPFEAALATLGASPREAVYVGDNPLKDFVGCRQLGISTIRLHLPGGVYADVEAPTPDHEPDIHVTSVSELHSVLV